MCLSIPNPNEDILIMDDQDRQQSCEIRPEPCGDEATFLALSEVDESTLSRWEQEVFEEYHAEQSALVPAATADPVTPTTYGPQVSPGVGDQGLWPMGGMNMINSIEGDDSTQNTFGTTYSTGSACHDHYRMGIGPCTQPRYPNTVSSPDSSLSPPFRQERHDMSTYQALMSDSPLLESTSMAARRTGDSRMVAGKLVRPQESCPSPRPFDAMDLSHSSAVIFPTVPGRSPRIAGGESTNNCSREVAMMDEGGRPPLGLGEQLYKTFPSLGDSGGAKPVPVLSYDGVSGGAHSSQKSDENGGKRSFSTDSLSNLLRENPMPALDPLRSLAHPSDSSAQHPKDLPVSWCTTDGLLSRPLALRSNESGEMVTLRKRSRHCSNRQWTREATDQVTQKLKPYHKAAVRRKQNTGSFVNTVSRAVEDLFRSAPLPQMSSATERLCQEAVNLGFDFTSRSSPVS